MLDRLRSFVAAAGPGGLTPRAADLGSAACLVVATTLIDDEFAEYVVSGTHPASG